MQLPLQITFRSMEPSEAIEAVIRDKAQKLERFYDRIMRCEVVVDAPHRHQHKGKVYHVKIDISVPNDEIVVSREPENNHAHEDVNVAIRDAFHAARRQLEAYARKQRGEVKSHEPPPHGMVARLVPDQDYGMIAASDGREVYFHRNSVLNGGFDKLEPGAEVRFAEEQGVDGPRATTVRPVGKHHIVG